MKTLKAAFLLCLLTLAAIACTKQATQNANTQAANTANANAASTAATKSVATPVSNTSDGTTVFTNSEGGIQFEVPSTWKTETEDEVLQISTPDDVLNISFWVHKEGSIEQASEEIGKELGKIMTDIEMGEETESNINGMKVYSLSGTGNIQGTTIQWSLDLIEAKKPVFVLSFAAPNLWEKHQKEYVAFVKSIKRMN